MDNFDQFTGPVLCVAAHPEDLEIHAGGAIARLVAAGIPVSYVLCTNGNRGTSDRTVTMEAIGARRKAEQHAAADLLGVTDLTFLRHDDGDLQYIARELRAEIVHLIRQKRPRTIITHDPFPGDGSHDSCAIYPDHLAVGMTTFEAAFVAAPGPQFHSEHLDQGFVPHKPDALYFIMSQRPDTFVEIGSVWETKMAAVHMYASQGRHLPGVEPFFRRIAEQLGEKAGLPMAEGFRRLAPS
ncbi:MAG: PIG-L deacetylase family protein [Chloroflexota bacterium]